LIAAGAYRAPLDAAIHRFKYGARPDLSGPLARLMLRPELVAACADPLTLFVPVPLHRARLAERGYDQSALLARVLAAGTARRTRVRALRRVRWTEQQARLDGRARASNVANAFFVPPDLDLSGRPVVLVDDVVTTGATASACLTALSAAGARTVAVACIALADE
jgi:ComF family protein